MTKKKEKVFLIPDSNRVSLRRNENCQLAKKKKEKKKPTNTEIIRNFMGRRIYPKRLKEND